MENVGAIVFCAQFTVEFVAAMIEGNGLEEAYKEVSWERRGHHVEDNYDQGVRPRGWPLAIRFTAAPVRSRIGPYSHG